MHVLFSRKPKPPAAKPYTEEDLLVGDLAVLGRFDNQTDFGMVGH